MTKEEYTAWMYNQKNAYKCQECPENRGFDAWQGRRPCGQYNCWVTCHCSAQDKE